MSMTVKAGVYSTQAKSWIGTGTTKRKTIAKRYWYAAPTENGSVKAQPLTSNLVPAGTTKEISLQEFLDDYEFEPDFFIDTERGSMMLGIDVSKTIDVAPFIGEEEPSEAEQAALTKQFLNEMEHEMRADYGMALTYLQKGHLSKAEKIFSAIPDKDIAWEPEHKHMFCEFGVGLRKSQMLDVALKHYFKAHELAPYDENLCHNIARVYYEQEEYFECKKWLEKSLELNPELDASKCFLRFLRKSGKIAAIESER